MKLALASVFSLLLAGVFQFNQPSPPPFTYPCQVRLTLTSGTPITTGDVTAATSVFVTPVAGGYCGLYNGSSWQPMPVSEVTVAVPATTSQMYDVFCAIISNAFACDAALAWTNDSTRATALTTQNGVYVKTGDATRRFVGSFRTTTVSGQTEDSVAKRLVCNAGNRVPRSLKVVESGNYNYTVATFRQTHGSTANQVAAVICVPEITVDLSVNWSVANTNTSVAVSVSIGEDSTTTADAAATNVQSGSSIANVLFGTWAHLTKMPAVGYHFYPSLEFSIATGTTTWFGSAAGPSILSGITGVVEN